MVGPRMIRPADASSFVGEHNWDEKSTIREQSDIDFLYRARGDFWFVPE